MVVAISPQEIVRLLELQNPRVENDELWASCPMGSINHKRGDKKPSWSINLKSQKHFCFSCGYSGNLVSAVMQKRGLKKAQAINEIYGELSVIEMMELMDGGASDYEPKDIIEIEGKDDVERWSEVRHQYWYDRGFTEETIMKWKLGYSSKMNRVTVPVWFEGVLVGWTARAVNNTNSIKWFHSEGLVREKLLFGYDRAEGDTCILVEAPLSVIMLDQYGYNNAVATFGSIISEGQARLIRSRFDNVVVFLDPDEAGRVGTRRVISLLEDFCEVFVVQEPRDDPAGLTKEECDETIKQKLLIRSWDYPRGDVKNEKIRNRQQGSRR